ncbi:hypothetical protein OIU77_003990 [Salix suchowensis]|uniref:MSP domain-containing protein n=1 Tax=Salix suchowensis TaxID=1278906 RepID=A0ABQ9AU56_9ROSI|nr:hypothetical protein OIU77_003990 [Salix suchowensis]
MTQLLEILPKELKFIVEVKKQSSCLIQLTNNTHHNVAFKVKTTSPKKYSVRPNVGIVDPKSTFEFVVTMQAQKVAPDMACRDKFLIQSTIVPVGTTEKDITPSMFAKDNGKHVEEVKMRVALISPPESPVLSPINGVLKQGPFFEPSVLKDPVENRVEILAPPQTIAKSSEFKKTNLSHNLLAQDYGSLLRMIIIQKSDKRKKSAHGIPTPICCYDCANQYHGGIPFTSLNT